MSVILVAAVSLCALSLALQESNDDCSHPPMQEVVPGKSHGYIRSVVAPSMYDCAAECKLSPLCLSFIFDPEKRTCQQSTEQRAKTHSSFTVGSGVFFSNIQDWKMSLTGACSDASCSGNLRCTLGRNGKPLCEIYNVQGIGMNCTRDDDCPINMTSCYRGRCLCNPGYSHNITSNSCDRGIGMNCTRDDDCLINMTSCYRGRCLCDPGYSHNITSNSCDRDCKRFANTMTLYKGLGIKGYNRKTIRLNRGFEDGMKRCTTACMEETSFVCKTADIQPNWGCYLSDVGYLDVNPGRREKQQRKWTMAVRRCQ